MSKVLILGDTHFGIKSDSPVVYKIYDKLLKEFLFPLLKERGIKTLIHMGDLVDKRHHITGITIDYVQNEFLNPLQSMGIETHFLVGNHDSVFKNTIKLNYVSQLVADVYPGFYVHDSIETVMIDGTSFLMVPWICKDNQDEIREKLKTSTASVCVGHFELSGFQMYRGTVAKEGMSRKLLEDFHLVLSGHYHTKSSDEHIHYVGIPFDFTWQDWNDPKGVHILDTKTLELEFIPSNIHLHKEIEYPFVGDLDTLKDNIVRVLVNKIDNYQEFDTFISTLEKTCASVKIVNLEENTTVEVSEEEIKVSDTLTIFKKFLNNDSLDSIINEIYTEALALK